MTWQRAGVTGAFIGFLACSTVAWADPPCLADIQKFCSNVPAGAGGIQECLRSNQAKLSPGCKGHVDGLVKNSIELISICSWDIERFCSGVAPGGGQVATCLQAHRDDLSPACKERFGATTK